MGIVLWNGDKKLAKSYEPCSFGARKILSRSRSYDEKFFREKQAGRAFGNLWIAIS